jgi:hypothetical protein
MIVEPLRVVGSVLVYYVVKEEIGFSIFIGACGVIRPTESESEES